MIVALSDTHNFKIDVPDGDVLIFAGDMCNVGRPDEIQPALLWLASLPHKRKIIVPGNHDVSIGWEELRWREFAESLGMELISHGASEVGGYRGFFSAWTPTYGRGWAYMADRESVRLRELWAQIPDDTELLVTHGPPHGILDKEEKAGFLCGCELLLERVKQLPNLKYHMFGHIHEQGGKVSLQGNTTFINLSVVNRAHEPVNEPFVIL